VTQLPRVFDLDGVLVYSESVWDAARREVVVASRRDAGDDGDELTGVVRLVRSSLNTGH
jgi:beta-phosphoglucomutase-like phosphatase (HAD superfamily)